MSAGSKWRTVVTSGGSVQSIHSVGIFKHVGCDAKFLDWLALGLETHFFQPGERILGPFEQGDIVDQHQQKTREPRLYILNRGRGRLHKQEHSISWVEEGTMFGDLLHQCLGMKYTDSIYADEACAVHVLGQETLARGLQYFPEERGNLAKIAWLQVPQGKDKNKPAESCTDTALSVPNTQKEWEAIKKRLVSEVVSMSPLLCEIGEDFLEELAVIAKARMYVPNELIIEQGGSCTSMFICVSGIASVRNGENDEVAKVTAGSLCGELAMLGLVATRSASIVATSLCCMWEVESEAFLHIFEVRPEVSTKSFLDIVKHSLERTVRERFDTLPLLRSFDTAFRRDLAMYSDRRACFPKFVIFKENNVTDGMEIINQGRVSLERQGVMVSRHTGGSWFNCPIMLGLQDKSYCTLNALSTVHYFVLTQENWQCALSQSTTCREQVGLLVKREKALVEEYKRMVDETVRSKRGMQLNPCGLRRLTDGERLELSFRAWAGHVAVSKVFKRRTFSALAAPQRTFGVCKSAREQSYPAFVRPRFCIGRNRGTQAPCIPTRLERLPAEETARRWVDASFCAKGTSPSTEPPLSPVLDTTA
eukprot:TRINITY_DN111188_c0_g1_i1.p1 TRINITY_DN111188_c0_g1~~TRINITY_DN111188_c0_g1_i1.p1  ORF type:complete len:592 (+),score=108.45 TRINITY_DN111188_c0_g1_i1:93-1868(+)